MCRNAVHRGLTRARPLVPKEHGSWAAAATRMHSVTRRNRTARDNRPQHSLLAPLAALDLIINAEELMARRVTSAP